jgi:hypothetical protein
MLQFYSSKLTSGTAYKATFKGDIFQLKLLMAVALRARQKAQRFMLNTEVVEAEKFDDLVVEYENSATVLQAKHSSKKASYRKKDFLDKPKEEASLAKYFDSFVRIKEKVLFSDKPIQYVFFSNRTLEDDEFYSCLTEAPEPDENLIFEKEKANCWQFAQDFRDKAEDYVDIYQEIAAAIKINSLIYYQLLSQDLEIDMSEHFPILTNAVKKLIIEISEQIAALYEDEEQDIFPVDLTGKSVTNERNLLVSMLQPSQDDKHAEFFSDFIDESDTLTDFQRQFRQQLIDQLIEKLNIDAEKAIEMLGKIIFQFPKKISNHVWMPRGKANEVLLKTNDDNNTLTWRPTKAQAYFVAGMFGKLQFAYDPSGEFPLSDLAIYRGLHKAIIAAIKEEKKINIEEVEEKFANYLAEFFIALRIKSGQPNEDELEDILQSELKISCQFSGDEYYAQFYLNMLNWFKDFKGKPFNIKTLDKIFEMVKVGIERLHLSGYSEHATRLLDDYQEVSFSSTSLDPIADFITANNGQSIMIVQSDDSLGLTLAACQVVKNLRNEKHLKHDNWGFADSKCRILDKVPEVLAQQYELMLIDKADALLKKPELLSFILEAAIKNNKKLILLCSTEKNELLKAEIPIKSLVEHKISSLSEEEINKACNKYLQHYIFVGGRYIQINEILAAKNSGSYAVTHSVSQLMVILKNAVESVPMSYTNQLSSVFVSQQVKPYTAFYQLKNVIKKLPKKYVLTIFPKKSIKYLKDELSDYLVLDGKQFQKYLKTINKDEEMERLIVFKLCAVGKHSEKTLEEFCKKNVVIIVDTSNYQAGAQTAKILKYLREKHSIIVITKEFESPLKSLSCIHASVVKATTGFRLILPLEERHFFGQPEYELEQSVEGSAYCEMNFLKRLPYNLPACVTANPGTGKSENFRELVRHWHRQIDLQADYHWLIVINLIDIDEKFFERPLTEVLIDYLSKSQIFNLSAQERQLWINILECDIHEENVKLLLDGWDEVKGIREDLVRKFIRELPEGVHYDIAMRPYVFNASPCVVYQRVDLQPFSNNDLYTYLKKRFTVFCKVKENTKGKQASKKLRSISDDSDLLEKKLQQFIQKILDWLAAADQKILDVVKIPLLAFLLSESLAEDWLAWLESDAEEPEGPWSDVAELNLVTLYEFFIVAKAKIYLRQHIGVTRSEILEDGDQILQLVINLLEVMEKLAFAELFDGLFSTQISITPELYRRLLDFGIIIDRREKHDTDIPEYRYVFMQQTFKELFAALYIVKALARSKEDPVYQGVLNTVIDKRYEINLKVVWRFVRDLLDNGSMLLMSTEPIFDARTIFTTPEDQVGVASRNLLSQLGLDNREVKIHEMQPKAVIEDIVARNDMASDVNIDEDVDEILNELGKNSSNKDTAISYLSKMPNIIPEDSQAHFNDVFSKLLSSWSYRIYGEAAKKIAETQIQIRLDILKKIKRVVLDKNCYLSERTAAIKAILKVAEEAYPLICSFYLELLDKDNLPDEIKVTVLCCFESIVGYDKALDQKISARLMKAAKLSVKSPYMQEVLLRRLLILKLCTGKDKFPSHNKKDWAKAIATHLTHPRLDLLLKLIKHEVITVEEIQSELISGLVTYDNRHLAISMMAKLFSALNEEGHDVTFLQAALQNDVEYHPLGLIVDALTLQKEVIFEIGQGENHWRFWRLDAGIPIARYFLPTPLKSCAFAYLIYQIRNNMYAYDVANKIGNLLYTSDCTDSLQRCMVLYLAFEYLIFNQHGTKSYFRPIDDWTGLISKLVNLAWQHFIADNRYPLIGLDVIFALGVCYGLPLIENGDQFKLVFVNITQCILQSPKLNSHQRHIVKEHFNHLRKLCGKSYELKQLIANERNSLSIQSHLLDENKFNRVSLFLTSKHESFSSHVRSLPFAPSCCRITQEENHLRIILDKILFERDKGQSKDEIFSPLELLLVWLRGVLEGGLAKNVSITIDEQSILIVANNELKTAAILNRLQSFGFIILQDREINQFSLDNTKMKLG